VLDAGAGDSPYRSYFSRVRYYSTDFCKVEKSYNSISFISNLENIPIRSDCYELVFCSQTLEHVPEPKIVLMELNRVLKPGGQLWLTAPLFYPEHEIPYDFYRYTRFGLTHLIQAAGFEIESIEWLEGYFGTFAYQLKEAVRVLPMKPDAYRLGLSGVLIVCLVGVLKILFALLSVFFTWLDVRTKYVARGQCKNYAVIAYKASLLD
jgi:SAM-dependent methyltransferase